MSNKQVVAIFIIGIVLLLGAFGAGLYVVKQDSSAASSNQVNPQKQGAEGEQTASDKYAIHVASFGTIEEASKFMLELRARYTSAYTQNPAAGQGLYQVNIGPYDRRDAEQVAEELRKDGRKGVMVKKWSQN